MPIDVSHALITNHLTYEVEQNRKSKNTVEDSDNHKR